MPKSSLTIQKQYSPSTIGIHPEGISPYISENKNGDNLSLSIQNVSTVWIILSFCTYQLFPYHSFDSLVHFRISASTVKFDSAF